MSQPYGDNKDEALEEQVADYIKILEPYFDSILFIGTYTDKDATKLLFIERGNSYAIIGSLSEYIKTLGTVNEQH